MTQTTQPFNSLIETPFISVKFGGVEFGVTSKVNPTTKTREIVSVTSLEIQRSASGAVNKYTVHLEHVVTPGTDPNYIDYIISRDASRSIEISYGDLSQPSFSYKSEKAIITKITPSLSLLGSRISYTIQATSSASILYALKRNYEERRAKPSDIIWSMMYVDEDKNGLLDIFSGMRNGEKIRALGLIARNDDVVLIQSKKDISPLEYIRYLVSQMKKNARSFYSMVIHDTFDIDEGPYFEVVDSALVKASTMLEIDVGYPSTIPVFDFTVRNDTSYALITPLQGKYDTNRIININAKGEQQLTSTPSLTLSKGEVDPVLESWWKNMTSFPIEATLSTRGLIIPAVLCQNIKINVLFYGQRYNYSGIYMVTRQSDSISQAGYRTALSLVRISGDSL